MPFLNTQTIVFIKGVLDKKYVEEPDVASVENPHDYKDLLTFSLKKLAQDGYIENADIPKKVDDILKHEFEHHTPGLGKEGLQIHYYVNFVEDKAKNFVGLRPGITLNGIMQIGIYKDIIGSVKKPSVSDKIIGD